MKSLKFLILFFVLLVVTFKDVQCKNNENEGDKPYPLATTNRDLRGLRDIWNKIKESAIASWQYIKDLAETTKEKIGEWTNDIKAYANELKASLEENLKQFGGKVNEIIHDIYGTGELVKQCVKAESENIQGKLKEIMKDMSDCVINEIKKLTLISGKQLSLNDTNYIEDLENKFKACEDDLNNVEECMLMVRKDVMDDVAEIEDDILKTSAESRSLATTIQNTLMSCSMDNLMNASQIVSEEVMEIAKCVLDSKAIPEEITPPPTTEPELE